MIQETKFTYKGSEIKEFAQYLKDDDVYFFMKCPLKGKTRSIAQNATFYLIVESLGKFLTITKENTKECILKAIFGVEKLYFLKKRMKLQELEKRVN